jgi:acetyl esterase/lipase
MLSPRSLGSLLGCLAITAATAFAGQENPALERIVPVPADQQIPILDFVRPILFRAPDLNHEGTRLAAIVSNTLATDDLVLVDLRDNSMDRLSADETQDVFTFDWLTDDRILFETSGSSVDLPNEWRVVQVDHPSGSYPVSRFGGISLVSVPEDDRLHPIFWVRFSPFGAENIGAVSINAMTHLDQGVGGAMYMSENSDDSSMMKITDTYPHMEGGVIEDFFADKDGQLAFGITDKDGVSILQRLAGDHWETCPIDLDHTSILGAGDKPGELIVAGPDSNGQPGPVERMDAATGQPGEVLYQDRHYDCETAGLFRSQATRKVLGIRFERRAVTEVWFDPALQSLQRVFASAFPGKIVEIASMDDAENRFVVKASSDVDPGGYYLVDLEKHSLGLLKHVAPWLDVARMRPRRAITYRARDGYPIEAYLTLPEGASKAHPVPLVVYPHGGPWYRDTGGFDMEAQYLASRGYAVLQPNYRGSTNYDSRFPYEDRFDFVKMRNDVTDGTKALIHSGLVDSNRIAIMGGSFGAYLAVCGAAFEPDLYRCAVALSGIYDWEQVMDEARQESFFDNPQFEFLRRHLGDPKANAAKFDAISPLRHIDQVKVPIFVYHGYDDPIASIGESSALVSKLDQYHVPYEKHFVQREGHGVHYLDHRVEISMDVEAFLAKNMGEAPAAR